MRIYTKIKIDIDSLKILEKEFFEYNGELAYCLGGGGSEPEVNYTQSPQQQQAFQMIMPLIKQMKIAAMGQEHRDPRMTAYGMVGGQKALPPGQPLWEVGRRPPPPDITQIPLPSIPKVFDEGNVEVNLPEFKVEKGMNLYGYDDEGLFRYMRDLPEFETEAERQFRENEEHRLSLLEDLDEDQTTKLEKLRRQYQQGQHAGGTAWKKELVLNHQFNAMRNLTGWDDEDLINYLKT